jgi:hypothetical protein
MWKRCHCFLKNITPCIVEPEVEQVSKILGIPFVSEWKVIEYFKGDRGKSVFSRIGFAQREVPVCIESVFMAGVARA